MRFYTRPGTKFLWCEHAINGTPVRFSTRTDNHVQAEKFAIDEIARRQKLQPARGPSGGILACAAADVARSTAEGSTTRHVLCLEKRWADIIGFFGESVDLNSINEERINDLILHLRARYKGQTISRYQQDLMRGLNVAYRRRWRTELLPLHQKVKSDPANAQRQSKNHPQDIVLQVFELLPVDVADACRVVSVTGLRYSTLRKVTRDMVHFYENGTALLRMPVHVIKGSKTGLDIDCPPVTAAILKRYVDAGRDVLFPRVNYAKPLATACRKVGYELTVTLRDLRAICASEVVEETQSLTVAQRRLGHATPRTTSKYVKFRPGKEQAVAESNLEERLGLTNMSVAQSPHIPLSVPKIRFSLSGLGERETGFEPATFSLEGSNSRVFPRNSPAFFVQSPLENVRESQPAPAHVRDSSAAARTPIVKDYERVKCLCQKCEKVSEQDTNGRISCIYCGGPVRIIL
jgi:integrase